MSQTIRGTSFVSAHNRAALAVALLVACGAFNFVELILHVLRLTHAGPFSGAAGDAAALEDGGGLGDLLMGLAGLTEVLVFIATVVAFLMWLHRAYKNLHAFGVRTEMSPGWAVGNWFIPFLNLVRPYQSVKELWIKSDPGVDFTHGFARAGAGVGSTALVGFWWFLWILANFASRAYNRLDRVEFDLGRSEIVDWAGEASSILTLAAAVLAAMVVRTIDRMQAEKSRQQGLNLWPAPPPPPEHFGNPPGVSQT
ncbi:MAG TPA: DUF4328 domain-containing protein [Pyrinomonadaceae bacterium]